MLHEGCDCLDMAVREPMLSVVDGRAREGDTK